MYQFKVETVGEEILLLILFITGICWFMPRKISFCSWYFGKLVVMLGVKVKTVKVSTSTAKHVSSFLVSSIRVDRKFLSKQKYQELLLFGSCFILMFVSDSACFVFQFLTLFSFIKMAMATSPSVDLSSYRDQHFKVCLLFRNLTKPLIYITPYLQGTRAEQDKLLRLSTTLYVGNLSFYTTEEQIYELFTKCGDIRRIVMGLDKYKKTPCGFCFVEYYNREDAENCLR